MKKAEAIEKMTSAMRLQRKSRWTIKAYLEWIQDQNGKQHKNGVFVTTCNHLQKSHSLTTPV